jgi:hypothetical protein
MAGRQVFGPDSIGSLTKTGANVVSLSASTITIGGLQYDTGTLSCDISTSGFGGLDSGSLLTHYLYYVHAVIQSGSPGLVASTSKTSPAGFNASKLVGAFYSSEIPDVGSMVVGNSTDRGIAFTPNFDQIANSNTAIRWWREGKFLVLTGGWTWGSSGGGTAQWYLPIISGVQLQADLPDSNLVVHPLGKMSRDQTVTNNDFIWFADDTIPDRLRFGRTQDTGSPPFTARLGTEIGPGVGIRLYSVKIPIVGWDESIL